MIHYLGLALLAGLLIPFQAGANTEIGRRLGHPLHGAVTNFLVGAAVLLLAAAFVARELPPYARVVANGGTPWWAWTGGLMGATFVLIAILAVPKIGSLNLQLLMLSGQLVAALAIDRFGLVGIAAREVTPLRLIGVGFVIFGALLVWKNKF